MNGKLFIGKIRVQNRNIVGDSVRRLAYDIPERNFSTFLSHYRKSILRQTYDNRMINRKIFCKSGPCVRNSGQFSSVDVCCVQALTNIARRSDAAGTGVVSCSGVGIAAFNLGISIARSVAAVNNQVAQLTCKTRESRCFPHSNYGRTEK